MDAMRGALEAVEHIGDLGLALTLRRAMHGEERRVREMMRTHPEVVETMRLSVEAQEHSIMMQRAELKEKLNNEKRVAELKREAKELQERTAKARKQLKDATDMVETQDALKSFSPDMLGEGRARGGGAMYRARRMDLLDRLVRHGAAFTPQQRNDWKWFKDAWDHAMSEHHNKEWGSIFAGIVQGVLDKLEANDVTAVSEFMYDETRRVLSTVRVIQA